MEEEPDVEYRFCLKDRVVCLRQTREVLFWKSVFPEVKGKSKSSSSGKTSNAEELSLSSLSNSKTPIKSAFSSFMEPQEDLDPREHETLAWLHSYFALSTDLVALYDTWSSSDPVFASFRERFVGIRMLRQDPWECLVS